MVSPGPPKHQTIIQFPPFRNPFLLPAGVVSLLLMVLIIVIAWGRFGGQLDADPVAEYRRAQQEYLDAAQISNGMADRLHKMIRERKIGPDFDLLKQRQAAAYERAERSRIYFESLPVPH